MTRRRASEAILGAALFLLLAALVPVPQGVRVAPFDDYASSILDGEVPFRDFSVEYPPGALPPIVLPALVPGVPYDDAFRAVAALLGAALVVGVALLLSAESSRRRVLGIGFVALLPVLLGQVVLHRYDLWPAMLVIFSLLALRKGRDGTAGVLLGAATAAKAYAFPLVGVVAVVAYCRRGRRGAVRVTVGSATSFLVLTVPFLLVAPGGVASAVLRQGARELQIESIGASVIMVLAKLDVVATDTVFSSGSWNLHGSGASAVATLSTVLGVAVLCAVAGVVWRRRANVDPVLACAAVVAVILVFSKVLSPQYLVWLVSLVAAATGAGIPTIIPLAGACVLTQVLYPGLYEELVGLESDAVGLVVVRNALLVVVAALLARELLQRSRFSKEPLERAG